MNRKEAAKLVAVMMASCPAQSSRLDDNRATAMVDAFVSLLDDVTYDEANAALRVLLQTSPYMPAVADIRKTVLELKYGGLVPGGEQWGEVLKHISRYGSYRTPGVDFQFADAVTAQCVKALGWQELCLSENAVADRARFIELYDKLAAQSHKEKLAPALGAAKQARQLGAVPDIVRQLAESKAVKP